MKCRQQAPESFCNRWLRQESNKGVSILNLHMLGRSELESVLVQIRKFVKRMNTGGVEILIDVSPTRISIHVEDSKEMFS